MEGPPARKAPEGTGWTQRTRCGQSSPLVNGVPLDKPPDLPEHMVPIPVTSWDGVGVGFK